MENYCAYCMGPMKGAFCGFCGHKAGEYTPLPHHLIPGTVLNGKYTLGRVLGEGGFGITYIGIDGALGLKVAIKEFFPSGLVNRNSTATSAVSANMGDALLPFEKGRSRFLQEAQTLARFAGEPGIVGIRDYFTENNTAYIVMDYLDGMTLRDFLKKHGKLTFDAAVKMLEPVMTSLQKVHEQELIHRDISPDNIMLMNNGQVKLLDFGAARHATGTDEKSLSVMLKPGFAPEEQYRTKGNQGPWTDVYALSATIYRCITGQNPEESMNRVFMDELLKPSELGAVISPVQEKALLKGLAVLQKNRYQTVGQLLDGFRGMEPIPEAAPEALKPEADPLATHWEPAPKVIASRVHVSQDHTPAPAENPAPQPVQAVPAASAPAPAPAAPAAASVAEKPRKKASLVSILVAWPLILLAVFLLALSVFSYMDERDTGYLTLSLLALLPGIPGVLLALSHFKRCEKDVSSKPCRILGLITAVIPLLLIIIMFRNGDNYAFYLIQLVLSTLWSYLLLRKGFAEHKARKKLNRICTGVGIVLVILVLVIVIYTTLSTITIGDQHIDRDATQVSIVGDMVTKKQLEKLSELPQLERLSIYGCFLDDDAIPYFSELTSLTSLTLSGNTDITDISALSGLTRLEELYLNDTSITDISVVENMPDLRYLQIGGTDVVDPTPINGLSQLYDLSLSGVEGLDWSKLVIPATVTVLNVEDTGISDLSMVETIDDLYILNASGNELTNVLPLQKFEKIDDLYLQNNQISDLTGIPDCATVHLENNLLTDISPLSNCTSAWNLILSDNQISDISPLSVCPYASYLTLSNNQVSDISPLAVMNLEFLLIDNNQISDISPLASSISMKTLYINDNQISDISVLSNMPELSAFQCTNNQISDISPMLATLLPESLDRVDLSGNNIQDVSPLSSFQIMNRLDLSENPVSDVSPLTACQKLMNLTLNETEVSDVTCFSGMPNLRIIEAIRTNITDYDVDITPAEEDTAFYLHFSYREDLDLELLAQLDDEDTSFVIYDVPENRVKMMWDYGMVYTVEATDLYLHPVEEITEAVEEFTEEADSTMESSQEVSHNE